MKVTGVEELSKSRSKVFVDGEPAFVLYRGELRTYGIREGAELEQTDYDAIMGEVLPKRAKLRAMNLLTKREYTEQQLRRKLTDGFYPPEVIEEALAYVAGFHYTDDLRYAVTFITDHEATRSRRRIEQDLTRRGIDRRTLEAAWEEWESDGGTQDEAAMIRALLAKKKYEPEHADIAEKRRIYAFLMRKGYSAEAVRRALRTEELDTFA